MMKWCRYTTTLLHVTVETLISIVCWTVVGAFFRRSRICKNLYCPWLHVKISFCICHCHLYRFSNTKTWIRACREFMLCLNNPETRTLRGLDMLHWRPCRSAFCGRCRSVVIFRSFGPIQSVMTLLPLQVYKGQVEYLLDTRLVKSSWFQSRGLKSRVNADSLDWSVKSMFDNIYQAKTSIPHMFQFSGVSKISWR